MDGMPEVVLEQRIEGYMEKKHRRCEVCGVELEEDDDERCVECEELGNAEYYAEIKADNAWKERDE